MNLPELVRTIRWMIRDTIRQSLATKLFWVMLGTTAIATLFCLSIAVTTDANDKPSAEFPGMLPRAEAERIGIDKVREDGIAVVGGEISLGFGMMTVPIVRSKDDAVKNIMLVMVGLIGDAFGILLALLWTAGFLPQFLEPQSATVLLSKPAPRWTLLIGKYLGVVGFVALNAILFVAGTWIALGLRTGVWYAPYWLAVPLLVINFGVFYSVSVFFAVWTRNTTVAAFGTILFWFVCWAINYTHHHMIAYPFAGFSGQGSIFLDIAYWVLPKPFDLGGIFFDAMNADEFRTKADELKLVQAAGRFHPELSILADGLFAAGALAIAGYELETMDY